MSCGRRSWCASTWATCRARALTRRLQPRRALLRTPAACNTFICVEYGFMNHKVGAGLRLSPRPLGGALAFLRCPQSGTAPALWPWAACGGCNALLSRRHMLSPDAVVSSTDIINIFAAGTAQLSCALAKQPYALVCKGRHCKADASRDRRLTRL